MDKEGLHGFDSDRILIRPENGRTVIELRDCMYNRETQEPVVATIQLKDVDGRLTADYATFIPVDKDSTAGALEVS